MDFINKDKCRESVEDLEARVAEYGKYETLEMKDLTEKTEIVFVDEHICNDNLKAKDKALMNPEQVIEDNEKSLVTLEECAKKYDEDPDVKKARLQSNEVALQEIKNRIEKRKYKEMTKNLRIGNNED